MDYPYPNRMFFVPPHAASSLKHCSSNYFNSDMIALNQPSSVSNLIPTNTVDTYVNNDDNSQSFVNHRKHNHSATKICDTNATTIQVQLKFHQII